jgi:RND family efflux transporter MFP subunit
MPRKIISIFPLVAALLLAGCSKPAPVAEEVRPIRAVRLQVDATAVSAEFAGEVRPRIESRLGFRVAGKLIDRKVEVGDRVKAGQVLARLDPQDYRLAESAAKAQAAAAEVERKQTLADYKRFAELHDKGFISAAELERRKSAADAALARHTQALASLQSQGNQSQYTELRADATGVVTGIDAEVGQVVSAGQPVVRVAQTAEKEVVVGIPENRVQAIPAMKDVRIQLWTGGAPVRGKVRELSPVADPATRTYPARITMLDAPAEVAWGMTASVQFLGESQPVLKLPLQALLQEGGSTYVWLYDAGSSTVKRTQVAVVSVAGNEVVVGQGVSPGHTVVTAGVHLLKEGQKVKLLAEDAATAARPAAAAPAATQPLPMKNQDKKG